MGIGLRVSSSGAMRGEREEGEMGDGDRAAVLGLESGTGKRAGLD